MNIFAVQLRPENVTPEHRNSLWQLTLWQLTPLSAGAECGHGSNGVDRRHLPSPRLVFRPNHGWQWTPPPLLLPLHAEVRRRPHIYHLD